MAADPAADAPPRIVIVGAGFGGLAAAKELAGRPAHVTVVDRRNHHLFQPLLYQVATAALSPADIAHPIRSALRGHQNIEVLMDEVLDINVDSRRIVTRNAADLVYDWLILATGSEYSYFNHADWPALAPGLKSIEDATEIRRRLLMAFEQAEMARDAATRRRLLTFVLVGGGPTGVEMAGAIAELAKSALVRDFRRIDPTEARILLLEASPRLLSGFPERLGDYALSALSDMGVEVRLQAPIEEIHADHVVARGERIPASTVIWGAGVKATPVGEWLGLETERNGAVRVRPDLSLSERPEIFVIGDAAHLLDVDGKPLPGLGAVAEQEGRYVGRLLAARAAGNPEPPPFRYKDRGTMATIGRSAAVADFGRLKLTGYPAWLLWGLVHIYLLIGFRNRLAVFVNWMWSFATYGRGARLITGRYNAGQAAGAEHRPGAAVCGPAEDRPEIPDRRRRSLPMAHDKEKGAQRPNPGDDAMPGTPGTGEDICPNCNGTGRRDGRDCPECGGSGKIIEGIGGG